MGKIMMNKVWKVHNKCHERTFTSKEEAYDYAEKLARSYPGYEFTVWCSHITFFESTEPTMKKIMHTG